MSRPKLLVLAATICVMACQPHAVLSSALEAPPRVCEIRQPAWCIYRSNITIQHAPSFNSSQSIWTIWGSYWREDPVIILEPRGCRVGVSDVVELVDADDGYEWDGRIWNSIKVRLRSDGACDLNLLSPSVPEDKSRTAFSAKLTLIQACQTDGCDGPTVGQSLWPNLQKVGANKRDGGD